MLTIKLKIPSPSLIFFPYSTVFCTLDATAKSAEDFVKTKDYVINSAKLIKRQNPSTNLNFLYCSSTGANIYSPFLYLKTKGEIEKGLCEIGFKRVSIFRPAFFITDKDYDQWVKRLFVKLINLIDYVVPKRVNVSVDMVSRGMLS